jgi:hypothetical protein
VCEWGVCGLPHTLCRAEGTRLPRGLTPLLPLQGASERGARNQDKPPQNRSWSISELPPPLKLLQVTKAHILPLTNVALNKSGTRCAGWRERIGLVKWNPLLTDSLSRHSRSRVSVLTGAGLSRGATIAHARYSRDCGTHAACVRVCLSLYVDGSAYGDCAGLGHIVW